MALTMKQWRVVKGLTQEGLAGILGVSAKTIAEWERDPDRIQVGKAKQFCDVLGLTLSDVIFSSDNPQICGEKGETNKCQE